MSAGCEIREAREEDLAQILQIEQSSREAPHWSEASWRECFVAGVQKRVVLVAETVSQMQGFIVMSCVAGVAELESIAVAESERRRGVGRALCEAGLAWARSEGAERVELEMRASSGARALYVAMGFAEEGIRQSYYRDPVEDAVLMSVRVAG